MDARKETNPPGLLPLALLAPLAPFPPLRQDNRSPGIRMRRAQRGHGSVECAVRDRNARLLTTTSARAVWPAGSLPGTPEGGEAPLVFQAALAGKSGAGVAAQTSLAILGVLTGLARAAVQIAVEVPAGATKIGERVIRTVDVGRVDKILAIGIAATQRLAKASEDARAAVAPRAPRLPIVAARGAPEEAATLVEPQTHCPAAGQAVRGVDFAVRHGGPAEDRVVAAPGPDVGAVEVGVGEVRPADVGPFQVGRAKLRAGQIGVLQAGPCQIRRAQVGAGEVPGGCEWCRVRAKASKCSGSTGVLPLRFANYVRSTANQIVFSFLFTSRVTLPLGVDNELSWRKSVYQNRNESW
jgi:hypothetical protein